MKTFNQFINDEIVQEKLITFGKQAYPKFNNVVIMAGGAGSGKGFQIENLIGIEGKLLDVDALKLLALKEKKFVERVKRELGIDLSKEAFTLKNPDNVAKLHEIIADHYGLPNRKESALFASILTAPPDRKPNLIFDVTLSGMRKLETITRNVHELGYDKLNIHIVWVINKLDVAIKQNLGRERVVPIEVLMDTHEGAALTMKKILDMGDGLTKYMDGDIWLTFNQVKVDTKLAEHDKNFEKGAKKFDFGKDFGSGGGAWVKEATYMRMKDQGKNVKSSDIMDKEIYEKIKAYVPKTNVW